MPGRPACADSPFAAIRQTVGCMRYAAGVAPFFLDLLQ